MGKANRPMMLSLLSLWFAGCLATSAPPTTADPIRPAFLAGDTALARAQLDSLSMEERIAQLMMVPLYSKPGEPESMASVAALITELGATSMADMGRVMGTASARFAGRADGKAISALVRQHLA